MPENLNYIGAHPDPTTTERPRKVRFFAGVPSGAAYEGAAAMNQLTGKIYRYESGVWVVKN
jgi:hypothetical protein